MNKFKFSISAIILDACALIITFRTQPFETPEDVFKRILVGVFFLTIVAIFFGYKAKQKEKYGIVALVISLIIEALYIVFLSMWLGPGA